MKKLVLYTLIIFCSAILFYTCTSRKTESVKAGTVRNDTCFVYTAVEQMPSFPGGEAELYKFIRTHLKYPKLENLCKDDFQCMLFNTRTTIRFVITPDGLVTDIVAIKNKGGALSDSLINTIKKMPRWAPGKMGGENVSVYYTIPMHLDFK